MTRKACSQDELGKWKPFLREGPEAKSYYRVMNFHVLSQKGDYETGPEYRSEKQEEYLRSRKINV